MSECFTPYRQGDSKFGLIQSWTKTGLDLFSLGCSYPLDEKGDRVRTEDDKGSTLF